MYVNRMLEIGKASNGYIIECRVPLKPDDKGKGKEIMCCSSSTEKQYVCKTAAEVSETITKLFPLLDGDYKTEEDFDTAFEEAAGVQDKKGGER